MHYGVHMPIFGPYGDARVLADLAYEAEEAGWNGFFLWDQVSNLPSGSVSNGSSRIFAVREE